MKSRKLFHNAVFRGAEAVASGVLAREELHCGRWKRLFRDVYADPELAIDHGIRCQALGLLLPQDFVIAGHSAAWLHGAEYLARETPVEVLGPYPVGYVPLIGTRIRTGFPLEETITTLPTQLLPVQKLPHTALHIARHYPLEEAVPALDRLSQISPEAVVDAAKMLQKWNPHRWRCQRAGVAMSLVEPRSASWQESQLRVALTLAGMEPETRQYDVREEGRFISRVDFAWPSAKVAVVCGAPPHEEVLAEMGWRVISVDGDALTSTRSTLLARIQGALRVGKN